MRVGMECVRSAHRNVVRLQVVTQQPTRIQPASSNVTAGVDVQKGRNTIHQDLVAGGREGG